MPPIAPQEFWYLLPEAVLTACGMLLLLVGTARWGSNRLLAGSTVAATVLTAALVWWFQGGVEEPRLILAEMFVLDRYGLFWKFLILAATALTVVLSVRYLEESRYPPGEYYALLLLASSGMLLMVSGSNLLSIWISLELMALSSYILAGYFKRERKSGEAAVKYFILGAVSSGVLLYGISLLYGATGELQLGRLAAALPAALAAQDLVVALGLVMLASGLFFKVAAVPFHMWTPDVYEGAPTPITAYLSAASKAASFAILVRIFLQALPSLHLDWQILVATVASASMIWGNLAALTQDNVKRMLAYSSIAHAGYVLMGLLAVSDIGLWSIIFYLLTYTFITMGVFGTVILLERREYAGETCADYAGLATRSPVLAAMMLLFMLALTGIPPTGGFVGKFYLFAAAIEAGWSWVALIGVLMSAVSLYYYFRIVYFMYQADPGERTPAPAPGRMLLGAIGVCALVTLLLGILPGPFIELAKASVLGPLAGAP